MNAARWVEVSEIAATAAELTGQDREAFLASRCAGRTEIRAEVESLLEAGNRSGPLDAPPFAMRSVSLMAGARIGAYRVLDEIGRGGMGVVYRAEREDGEFQRQVAIKVISLLSAGSGMAARFQNEKRIVAALLHPNIAQLLDAGTTGDGVPYLVMELVEGVPIDRYCGQIQLSIPDRIRLMQQICDAVQFAHSNLVIHRDIKPANILVTPQGTPKLLDFGIAKILSLDAVESESTVPEARLMTLNYASPEMVRGEPVTTTSDVYSLGLVLYQVLAGCPAHPAGDRSLPERLRQICEEDPRRPSQVSAPHLSGKLAGDLDNIVGKAIRKAPAERYASPRDLANDLDNYLMGRPVRAVEATPLYRVRKWAGRHRIGVAVAAAALVALVGAVTSVVWQARIAEHERQAAVAARQVAEERRTEAEAQRAAAERRFQEVRKLANQVLFDYQDQLASLSAASKLRARMAEDALQYLDALAGDRSTDVDLQLELARGYREVALVQGVPRQANLGDSTGARRSLQKAKAILDGILVTRPGFRAARFQRGWVLLQLSRADAEDSANLARRCLDQWEELHREAPEDDAILRGLAWAHVRLAELGRHVEHGTKAVRYFEMLLQRKPDDATLQGNAAYAHRLLAEGFRARGEPQRTLDHGLKARDLTERAIKLTGNPATRKMELSFGIEYVGLGLMESGRPQQSLEHFREAVRLREEIHQANPEDAFVQHRLLNGYMQIGIALEEIKDWTSGEAWREQVSKLVSRLTYRDSDEWNSTLGWVYSTAGTILANLEGRRADACESLRLADRYFTALGAEGLDNQRATKSRWNLVRNQMSSCAARAEVRDR